MIFSTIELETMLEKITSDEIVPKENIQQNANKYLLSLIDKSASKENTLIYFSMEGCPDCIQINPIIDSENIKNKFNILKIYRDEDPNDGRFLDNLSIFKQVYDIDWYPSFIFIRDIDNFQIIREVPSETLEKMLMNLN